MLNSLKPRKVILSVFLLLGPFIGFGQWTQIGNDIDGEAANDQFGYSVSLNADGNTVAIGARNNSDNGGSSGHVRVFENITNVWQQKGSDIDGIAVNDFFGFSVSINADGNTIAVGAPNSNANGFESGHVRAYRFEAGDWVLIGNEIPGDAVSDHSGYAVSLSDDGNRLAIGAPDNGVQAGVGSNFGQVRIYENQSDSWVQIGDDIIGENPEDNSGSSVSLNHDGSIVAIGAPNNDETDTDAGHVRVYALQAGVWIQIGQDILGESLNDEFGGAISLNNQGNILAIGSEDNNASGDVRVFEFQTNTWIQIGSDIEGEASEDDFGFSVSLNANGTILAVGARFNSDLGVDAGHVRIYRNQSGNWIQIDEDIDGEAILNRSGRSVSLNADGNIVAIGAHLNDDNGNNAGHVRVFSNANVLNIEDIDSVEQFSIYPNPATAQIHINLEKIALHSKVELYTIQGKLLLKQSNHNINRVTINIATLSKGIYILKLQLDKTLKALKIIKQ